MFISDHDLSELRSRTDIVQIIGEKVPLKKAGRHFKGCCPFHQEKTPSFMVQPEKQIYHCFGCGVGGDVFSFVMKYENVSFPEAIERLADRYGFEIKSQHSEKTDFQKVREEKELSYRINRLAARFFYEKLLHSEDGARARAYLSERAIHESSYALVPLGYAPDGRGLTQLLKEKNAPLALAEKLGLIRRREGSQDYYDFFRDRIIFTILSSDDKVLGFSGRALGDAQPKYLNSPESLVYHKSDSLLGFQKAKEAIREKKQVILVEGNFDMLRLHQEGILQVVAPLGTALTSQQVKNLSRIAEQFILLFDGDAAGIKASARALEIFLPLGISPRVITLPQGEDPDSFVKVHGREAMEQKIAQAPLLMDVRLEQIFGQGEESPERKTQSIRQARELIGLFQSDVEKRVYGQRVAHRFGIPEEILLDSHKTTSNFSTQRVENKQHRPQVQQSQQGHNTKLPVIEKKILEVFLSGKKVTSDLMGQISGKDFTHPLLGRIWEKIKAEYERCQEINVTQILALVSHSERGSESGSEPESAEEKRLITELAMASSSWQEEDLNEPMAEDCVKKLKKTRLQDELKKMSQEIRKAELERNESALRNLLVAKNQLMKELRSYH